MGIRPYCLFATAPDVPCEAAPTLQRSRPFFPIIRAMGYPVAFVAQNGLIPFDTPWDEFDTLFIGGTTDWKLGPEAANLTKIAREIHHKPVHMGRVNSRTRYEYAESIGCTSVDGSGAAFDPIGFTEDIARWASGPITAQCESCGDTFYPSRKHAKTCSDRCRQRLSRANRAPEPRHMTVLSLGAGVQSTTLALLAHEGKLPRPDIAVFADTGWEPEDVYIHLGTLTEHLKDTIPIVRVGTGSLREDTLSPHFPMQVPVFTAPSGMVGRTCTSKYKIRPIERYVRAALGAMSTVAPCTYSDHTTDCHVCHSTGTLIHVPKPPQNATAEMWIGFSTDEITRVSGKGMPAYMRPRFPLIELNMSRTDCEKFLMDRGWTPRKSACIGCPFHSTAEWLDMKENRPTEWADAVEFDAALRSPTLAHRLRETAYLHQSRRPLPLVPLSGTTQEERTHGCSPYGCYAPGHD